MWITSASCVPCAVRVALCIADRRLLLWLQQALMFKNVRMGFVEQIKTMFKHTKRLADS